MDAEFVALDGLDEDDARARGFALDELLPPQRRGRRATAHADGAAAAFAALTASPGTACTCHAPSPKPTCRHSTALAAARPLHHPDHGPRRRADRDPSAGAVPARRRTGRADRPLGPPQPAGAPCRPGAGDLPRPARLRVAVVVPGQGRSCARADLELRGRAPARQPRDLRRRGLAGRGGRRPHPRARSQRRRRLALRIRTRRPAQPAARHHRLPLRRATHRPEVQAQPEPPARQPRVGRRRGSRRAHAKAAAKSRR